MTTTAPSTTKQIVATPQARIRDLLDRQQNQIVKALPSFMNAERFVRVALTTINKTPKLLDCTDTSLMACLMDCAQLGLEPDNIMGRAYLIPFNDKKNNRMVCTLIVGYKGLIDLAYRSGRVKSLMAQIVCARDEFHFEFGLHADLKHKPYMGTEDRGDVVAVYAYAILEGGITAFDVMSVEDVERIMDRSKSKDAGPWQTDWREMARKTVLKRLAKYLPLSVEFMDALNKDNENETVEEERLRTAKIVLPKSEPTTVEPAALEEGEAPIPMPTRKEQREKQPVSSRGGGTHEEVKTEPGPTDATSVSTTPAQAPAPEALTEEEKAAISSREAMEGARELASADPAGALVQIMAIDQITDKELADALRACQIRIPRDFSGPDCLIETTLHEIMETKAWNAIRSMILKAREAKS
jgi:recombination protein RecT